MDSTTKTMPTNNTLDWARRYLAMGLHPVPLRSGTKRPPLISWKKYQDTAPTEHDLAAWFSNPDRNIALVLGRGVFAVDLDGPRAEDLLRARGIELPQFAPRSKTSHGFHVLLEAPGPVPDRVGLLSDPATKSQVDIRGVGYIVAPPSTHPSGSHYAWIVQPDEPPCAPQPLLDLIKGPPNGSTMPYKAPSGGKQATDTPKWVAEALRGVSEGKRDSTCARITGYFLSKNIPPDIVLEQMTAWADRCQPPFPHDQVEKTINSFKTRHQNAPFQCLGWNNGTFYFLPKDAPQVVPLHAKDLVQANFFRLAPLDYWSSAYPGDRGPKWDLAQHALIRQSTEVGVYDASRIRGRGAWLDAGSTVVHLGDRVVIDGEPVAVSDVPPGRYVYQAAAPLDVADIGAMPLTAADGQRLVELLGRISWQAPVNAKLLAGWCAAAPVCGALSWRPHIWITGTASSGKTWVLENIVRPVIGDIGLSVLADTTDAGLRQTLGHDARPVIFDEIEGEDQRAQTRVQNVLALARQASSETGASILKGTTHGTAMAFRIRSCFAFSSIGVSTRQHADVSRVTVLQINRDTRDDANARFQDLEVACADLLTPGFIAAMRARMLSLLPTLRQNCVTFSRAGAPAFKSKRYADQIGALLAGYYTLCHDQPATQEQAAAAIASEGWVDHRKHQDTSDEQRCLSRILEHIITIPGSPTVQRSVAELLNRYYDDSEIAVPSRDDADRILRRHGIHPFSENEFAISNTHSAIAKILADTPWADGWGRTLGRLPGSMPTDNKVKFAGDRSRGVIIKYNMGPDTSFDFGQEGGPR